MTSACLSVCLSVTFITWWTVVTYVHKEMEIGTWQDRSVSWLSACWNRPGLCYLVRWILLRKTSGYGKMCMECGGNDFRRQFDRELTCCAISTSAELLVGRTCCIHRCKLSPQTVCVWMLYIVSAVRLATSSVHGQVSGWTWNWLIRQDSDGL